MTTVQSTTTTENISTQTNPSASLLEQAVKATKHTERNEAEALLKALTENVLNGTVTWEKSLVSSINQAIDKIDELLSKQLLEIMHADQFKQLEGSWRGLHHLVSNTETSSNLKIKLLNASKNTVQRDLDRATEFDQSQLFKKIYENEFGMPGGEPYSILIGDYEFSHHPEDVDMLSSISNIAAASFCPFISAASSEIMGFDSWSELSAPRDLEKIFDSKAYTKWKSFRHSEDSRFVSLTMPRVLARLPYGSSTKRVSAFNFEEITLDSSKQSMQQDHNDYCWTNAAYALGTQITKAYAKYGWTTAIRGAEGGGKVEDLPLHVFTAEDGDLDAQCPTEIGIADRREFELSKLGFLPLCHYKNTDYAVFFGGQTTQQPKKYDNPEATENAAISARLPYLLATSRFSHYLKVMARDKIGSFMEASDCEQWLNHWINNYVNANEQTNHDLKAKYPLAEAKVVVNTIPGQPGSYSATVWLRPWLQFEELTTSMRMVARIPKLSN